MDGKIFLSLSQNLENADFKFIETLSLERITKTSDDADTGYAIIGNLKYHSRKNFCPNCLKSLKKICSVCLQIS